MPRGRPKTVHINLDQITGQSGNAEEETLNLMEPQNDSLNLIDEVLGGGSDENRIGLANTLPEQSVPVTELNDSKQSTHKSIPGVKSIITVGSVNPRNYDGKDDVEDYLNHFTYISNCNNWDPNLQRMRLPAHLRGVAELWYTEFTKQYKDKNGSLTGLTIDEIYAGLRDAFRPKNYQSMTQTALICRHQGLGESVADYYYDIMRLCNKMNPNMTEGEKLTHVMRGLKSGMLEKVLVLEPKNCLDLLGKLRSIEEAEFMSSQRPGYNLLLMNQQAKRDLKPDVSSPVQGEARMTSPDTEAPNAQKASDNFDKLCQMFEKFLEANMGRGRSYGQNPNQAPNQRRTVDGRIICNFCNVPGHISRNCYRRLNATAQTQAVPTPVVAPTTNAIEAAPSALNP